MSVESSVNSFLVARQEFSPIEYLRAEGEISEEHYRAWRTGRIPGLDDALDDGPRIKSLLKSASSFVRALGMVSESVAYYGLDDFSGRPLSASMDPLLNELLCCRYRRSNSDQGDLFLDGGKTASVNALLEALLARDADLALGALTRVSALIPDYRYLRQVETLISALEAPPPDSLAGGFESLERMQRHWLPAAREFLGSTRGVDFLAPLWLDIGLAIESAPFDPEAADRHASHAFEQARDWQRLQRAVLAEPHFRTQPALLARLARAECRLANRTEALGYWFAICLLAPDEFSKLVESSDFEEPGVARAWQLAMTEGDGEEELSAEWFPAWMLIHEPGLARALSDMAGASPPERAFNLVRTLRLMPDEQHRQPGRRSIELRGELRQIHPQLLRTYLDRPDRSSPVR